MSTGLSPQSQSFESGAKFTAHMQPGTCTLQKMDHELLGYLAPQGVSEPATFTMMLTDTKRCKYRFECEELPDGMVSNEMESYNIVAVSDNILVGHSGNEGDLHWFFKANETEGTGHEAVVDGTLMSAILLMPTLEDKKTLAIANVRSISIWTDDDKALLDLFLDGGVKTQIEAVRLKWGDEFKSRLTWEKERNLLMKDSTRKSKYQLCKALAFCPNSCVVWLKCPAESESSIDSPIPLNQYLFIAEKYAQNSTVEGHLWGVSDRQSSVDSNTVVSLGADDGDGEGEGDGEDEDEGDGDGDHEAQSQCSKTITEGRMSMIQAAE